MKQIYLDYNATTPIDPGVAEQMILFIKEHFGNPSSNHSFGLIARKAVDKAREQVAGLIKCQPDEVVFTSGGTESNNHAIKGVALANRSRGNHIITSTIEHPAVTEVCRYLSNNGFNISYLPVDEFGLVDTEQLKETITPQTILVSIMHANNEVGTIQPITELSRIAHDHNVLFHSDCAQSLGKIPVNVDKLGIDLLSIAGHKLYAPKGIGALFIKKGTKIEKYMHGANHEQDRRAGTENVVSIVGLGKACECAQENLDQYQKHLCQMRDRFEDILDRHLDNFIINGHLEKRIPNTSSISFKGLKANEILTHLETVAASAGAACHSEGVTISSVIKAMNIPRDFALGTIRFSTGRYTTDQEISRAADAVITVIKDLTNA